jgi:hypothetical protein
LPAVSYCSALLCSSSIGVVDLCSVQSKVVICEMLQQVVWRSNKFDHQIQKLLL